MQEIPVQFLDWEDPLKKGQATHSSIHGLPYGSSGKGSTFQFGRPGFDPWVEKIPWRRAWQTIPVFLGSAGKESACNAGDLGSIPGLRRFPGAGKGYRVWYSSLGNSMDCIIYEVTKSWTRLSNFHFHIPQKGALEGRNSIQFIFVFKE